MGALQIVFGVLMFLTALLLILLVLVQRGRGGGLSGALGGMGGQSAFGTKAGDLFTRITVVVATVWIALCIFAILLFNRQAPAQSDEQAREKEGSTEFQVVQPVEEDEADAEPTEGTPGLDAGPVEGETGDTGNEASEKKSSSD